MIDRALIDDLKQDEGWRAHVYDDSLGFKTIGFGFLVDSRRGGGLPLEIGEAWLEYLIQLKQAELDRRLPWWREQSPEIQRALSNMAYQLGVGGLLTFSKMLAALHRGDLIEAARQALDSDWSKQTPARAARVAALIRGSKSED